MKPHMPTAMIFREGTFSDPYKTVSNYLVDYFYKNKITMEDVILDIETTILGRDKEIAILTPEGDFDFVNDWYEGGDIRLWGYTPVKSSVILWSFK
jgi:hypothetical protein